MSKRIKDDEYVSLLEQAVKAGPVHITAGPENAGKGDGDFSKTGPESGMNYKGVSVDGDKILNWDDTKGDQYHSKKLDDVDELVESLTNESEDTEHDWDESPMAMLESDESDDKDEKEEDDKDEKEETEELDVDEELEESYKDVSFTDTESEVISKLIKEMTMLESEEDVLEDDSLTENKDTSDESDIELDLD